VLENRSAVYDLAYRILGNPDLAGVATEDTFLRAFPVLARYRAESSKLWLMGMVVTVCQEQLHKFPHLDSDSGAPHGTSTISPLSTAEHIRIDCSEQLGETEVQGARIAAGPGRSFVPCENRPSGRCAVSEN
jgi:hypothetical protein